VITSDMPASDTPVIDSPPKLLDQMRDTLWVKHCSIRTGRADTAPRLSSVLRKPRRASEFRSRRGAWSGQFKEKFPKGRKALALVGRRWA